jgi:hypothetical protein
MMLTKYSDFKSNLNENVQQAKTYLKNRALKIKRDDFAANKGDESSEDETKADLMRLSSIGLDPQEVRRAEQDPNFLKIKDLLKDAPGYTYVFTKFFFEDLSELEPNQRFEDLKNLYLTLREMRQSISSLPMPVDRYTTQNPTPEDKRGPYERLLDDLEKLKGNRVTTRWVNQLLVWQKAWFEKPTPVQKERIDGIAAAFDEFGKEPDGTKDVKKNKELQEYFFLKIKKYKTIGELIQGAENYVKSANNAGMAKFLQAVAKTNMKYGEINGAEEVYNEKDVLILEVRTFVANRDLNSNTSHCIANSQASWDSYCGDNKFTKQYYIYNFNLAPSDVKSVIGITIGEGGRVTACHAKNDGSFGSEIGSYMKRLGIDMSVLAPMSKEEIEKKKKRMIANQQIVKPKTLNQQGVTLEQAKQFFEEGADPNAQQGAPLQNAVKEDDIEKARYLLDVGAYPNVGNAIKYAQNLPMIKLLVDKGSNMTTEVFHSIMKDYEAVEYVLNAGVDPNFEKGYPIRTAAKLGDTRMINMLVKAGADIKERRYMVVKYAVEHGKLDVIKLLLEKMRQLDDPNLKDPSLRKKFIEDWVNWCHTSDKIDDIKKEETSDLLRSYLNKETKKDT